MKAFESNDEKYAKRYINLLDARMQRSQLVGTYMEEGDKLVLFHERSENAFVLMVQLAGEEMVSLYECIVKEQWGRKVFLVGSRPGTKGVIAIGHATLHGDKLTFKLPGNKFVNMEVDGAAPELSELVNEKQEKSKTEVRNHGGKSRTFRSQQQRRTENQGKRMEGAFPVGSSASDSEDEDDLSAEDLARLRGEIPMRDRRY